MTARPTRWNASMNGNSQVESRIASPIDPASSAWKYGSSISGGEVATSRPAAPLSRPAGSRSKGCRERQDTCSYAPVESSHAAREQIDDRGFGFVAVEPVVGDHPSGKDDRHPERKREGAGQFRRARRDRGAIPFRETTVHAAVVKDPGVERRRNQEHGLQTKEHVVVRAQRDGKKEQDAA